MSILSGLFGGAAGAARAQVAIASNLTPRVVVPLYNADGGAAEVQAAPGPLDFLLRMVKPSVRVETSLGAFAFEPFGPPDPTAGGVALAAMAFGGTVLTGLAVFGLLQLVRGRK